MLLLRGERVLGQSLATESITCHTSDYIRRVVTPDKGVRGLWREVVGDDESNTCPGLTPSRVVIDVSAVYLTNQKVVPMGGSGLRSTNPDSHDAIPLL